MTPRRVRRATSVAESIKAFLRKSGTDGATLREIYSAVRGDLGERVPDTSVRSVLYKRLVTTTKSAYLRAFERFQAEGESRYRLAASVTSRVRIEVEKKRAKKS